MLTFLFLCPALFLSAQINLNKAKDMVKDKKEKSSSEAPASTEQQKTAPAPEKSRPAAPAADRPNLRQSRDNGQSGSGDRSTNDLYKPSTVELDFDSEPFPAAITWASLLAQGNWYFNATTGEMSLRSAQASFLPQKTKSGEAVRYESYSSRTPLLRMEVWDTKANALKETMHYEAKLAAAPFYDMTLREGYDFKTYVKLTEGSYELRFWAGTRHFYTFPFEVEKKSNPDAYAPVHDFYFLKGAWKDWGRVEFGPDGHFIFNFYDTYQTTTVPNQAQWDVKKDGKYTVKLYRDGKMVAVHSLENVENKIAESDIQLHNGKWERFDCTFHAYPPASKGNGGGSRAFFLKPDMKDGSYTVEVMVKDLAGAAETFKYGFTVKDGAIVPAPEADRKQNTDPLHVVEQGREFFYVKRI